MRRNREKKSETHVVIIWQDPYGEYSTHDYAMEQWINMQWHMYHWQQWAESEWYDPWSSSDTVAARVQEQQKHGGRDQRTAFEDQRRIGTPVVE